MKPHRLYPNTVARLRRALGLNQAELAVRAGDAPAKVNSAEFGKRLRRGSALLIASALNQTLETVFPHHGTLLLPSACTTSAERLPDARAR